MLHEVKDVSQHSGEPFRRWFCDAVFDLIVWCAPDQSICGFQLCYREREGQKALTWFQGKGFTHLSVEDGEGRPLRAKMAPILVPDGTFNKERVLNSLERESKNIDPRVAKVVIAEIGKYPKAA